MSHSNPPVAPDAPVRPAAAEPSEAPHESAGAGGTARGIDTGGDGPAQRTAAARSRGRWRAQGLRPRNLVLAWCLTRIAMLAGWFAMRERPLGDPQHYFASMTQNAFSGALPEYPVWVVWLLEPLRLVSGSSLAVFGVAFALVMSAFDIATTALLWRDAGYRAAWYWMLFGCALGAPLVWLRFDIVTGSLVVAALVVRRRRPGLSGTLVAVAAAIKLWPVVLLATMWRRGRAGLRFLLGFVGSATLLVAVAAATSGWGRLVSPLRWQGQRGLQIESVLAAPLMLAHAFRYSPQWQIRLSRFLANEIFGPGVATTLRVGTLLTVPFVVLVVVMAVRSWRADPLRVVGRRDEMGTMALSSLALITAFIVVNKTFSPQYLYWTAGPLAVLMAVRRRMGSRRVQLLAGAQLAICAVTQVIFPHHYHWLYWLRPSRPMVVLLELRNLGVVVVCVQCVRWALRRTAMPPMATDPLVDPLPPVEPDERASEQVGEHDAEWLRESVGEWIEEAR